jgi:hypothetical protein
MHASGGTDEAQAAAFAGESGALTHESADAGAIHLDEAAEIDEKLFATGGGDALKFVVEEFAIFTERGAAARLDDHDVSIGASVDFEFGMFDVHIAHQSCESRWPIRPRAVSSRRHYTTEKQLRHPEVSG